MKKKFSILAIIMMAFAVFTTIGCKKDAAPEPDLAASLDKKIWTVESIQANGYDLRPFILSNYEINPTKNTLFDIRIGNNAGSTLYKEISSFEKENCIITETIDKKLSIYFSDENKNWVGNSNQNNVPEPLYKDGIITSEYHGGYYSELYCSSECLNGIYELAKDGSRYVLTRIANQAGESTPVVTITLKE